MTPELPELPRLEKFRRVRGRERTELAAQLSEHYRHGASIRDLAAATGRSYGFVYRLLHNAGTVLRPRGGGPRARKTRHARTANLAELRRMAAGPSKPPNQAGGPPVAVLPAIGSRAV